MRREERVERARSRVCGGRTEAVMEPYWRVKGRKGGRARVVAPWRSALEIG